MKQQLLAEGKTFTTSEKGNSMEPLIKSGQDHILAPATWEEVKIDDIVFCKVNGSYYTHLVKGTSPQRGVLIANNKGKENGWTKQVFGKVIKVLP